MATAPAFVSALDSLLAQRDREYTRDMNFAIQLQNAKMAVEKENTNRAQLNAQTAIAASQEQRARDNQSMVNYRNDLTAPLEGSRASRAAYLQQQQPARDAINAARLLTESKSGLFGAKLDYAYKRQATPEINALTGYDSRIIDNRVMLSPTPDGDYRDMRTNKSASAMSASEDIAATAAGAQKTALERFMSPNPTLALTPEAVPALSPTAVPTPAPIRPALLTPALARTAVPTPTPMQATVPTPAFVSDFALTPTPTAAGSSAAVSPFSSMLGVDNVVQRNELEAQLRDLLAQKPIDRLAVNALRQQISALPK